MGGEGKGNFAIPRKHGAMIGMDLGILFILCCLESPGPWDVSRMFSGSPQCREMGKVGRIHPGIPSPGWEDAGLGRCWKRGEKEKGNPIPGRSQLSPDPCSAWKEEEWDGM